METSMLGLRSSKCCIAILFRFSLVFVITLWNIGLVTYPVLSVSQMHPKIMGIVLVLSMAFHANNSANILAPK